MRDERWTRGERWMYIHGWTDIGIFIYMGEGEGGRDGGYIENNNL